MRLISIFLLLIILFSVSVIAVELPKGSVCHNDAACESGECWTLKSTPSIGICDNRYTPMLRNEIVASKKYGKQCSKDTDCKSNALRCWNVQGDIAVCDLNNFVLAIPRL